MKTDTIIIVGGFGRTGTNSVLQYLHLNNEIFGFVSGKSEEFDGDFNNYVDSQVPQISKTDLKLKLKDFIDLKNARFYTGTDTHFKLKQERVVDHFRYIAKKHENIELDGYLDFFVKSGLHLKFIFCVRSDFCQLYMSRKENRQRVTSEEFISKCLDSFYQMQRIAERYDSCCIDVTDGCASYDYERIDTMLGIEVSAWQDWWRKNNPKTNARPDQDLGDRVFPDISEKTIRLFRKAYYKTRSKLI